MPADRVGRIIDARLSAESVADIVKAYGLDANVLTVPYGQVVKLEQVEAALKAEPATKGVFVQASETSTGAAHDVEAIDGDPTLRGRDDPGDRAHGRRLAGSVRSHERENLSRPHLERKRVDRLQLLVRFREALDDECAHGQLVIDSIQSRINATPSSSIRLVASGGMPYASRREMRDRSTE